MSRGVRKSYLAIIINVHSYQRADECIRRSTRQSCPEGNAPVLVVDIVERCVSTAVLGDQYVWLQSAEQGRHELQFRSSTCVVAEIRFHTSFLEQELYRFQVTYPAGHMQHGFTIAAAGIEEISSVRIHEAWIHPCCE
jgi:hypothetical protein